MYIIRNTALSITAIVSCICLFISFMIFMGININEPVIGYCNFYNCTCINTGPVVCEQYKADVYYRIYDRKYPSYDTWVMNVTLSACPLESICYMGTKITDKNVYFVMLYKLDSGIFQLLTYIFVGVIFVIAHIKCFVVTEIDSNASAIIEPTEDDTDIELEG